MSQDRLFTVSTTDTERRRLRLRNQRAQLELVALETPKATVCPACSGIGDACTCHRTGAEALPLQ